jgi:outer membrane receptor protein involved in Fe transport
VDGKPVRRLTNGDQATFMGVTLAGETRPLIAGLGLYGRLMWIDGEIEQVGGGTANPRRLPPLQGRAGLSWRDPGESLVVGVHTTFAARQDKLNSSDRSDLRVCADPSQPNRVLEDCDGTPGWATLGLQARWRLTDKVSVFGRGENLLDARYRVHGSGFDAPGLSIRLGAQADL